MQDTINRLTFEMQDARRSIAVFEREQQYYEREAAKWREHKRQAHYDYYRAKSELKQLTENQKAA